MKTIINNRLYKIDESTNAHIPIVATSASDDCVVEQNQLFKLDKDTNGFDDVI